MEAEAQAALADYVRNNWGSETDGDELPDDEEETVSRYLVENVLEAYAIAEIVPT